MILLCGKSRAPVNSAQVGASVRGRWRLTRREHWRASREAAGALRAAFATRGGQRAGRARLAEALGAPAAVVTPTAVLRLVSETWR